ncbi:helix-turn-helix domain-containing protein [Sphingobacterium sp. DN00404]|uniref:Helix-turn-helix domain-containing protein n=1 Tax=Sphingobacterium micropteri TaxID=2763501 RepID=A0ABR7YKC4_9SPHI|nr:helix-turn-helix domain-containing protein [Sphingobacterium micropteri]MBD1431775.1 helix-turn-helix domain-containing protein [Sphingobacterium micropteri]
MKKSLFLNLEPHFGIPRSISVSDIPGPTIPIQQATVRCYDNGQDYAIEQEFDAKDCYLYSYDFSLLKKRTISVQADMADLHVFYLLQGDAAVALCNDTGEIYTELLPEHGRCAYLPGGRYQLQFEAGTYCLFGFYFDGGLFRDGNERPFSFLHEVIEAYRANLSEPVGSIDFPAGEYTLNQIRRFCQHIKKGDIENEKFVLQELIRLLKLAKEKIYDAYERTTDPELLIQRCRDLLAGRIAKHGNAVRIRDVAGQLHVRHEYLSRLHQQYYQQKLNDYRDGLVTEKIRQLLEEPYTLLEISVLCGFPGVRELNRFFKRKTGMTPAQYRRR